MMPAVAAVVITLNEEKKLAECLESVKWADEILVIDGGSKDRTVEIASKYTRKIYVRALDDFASQRNYGSGLTQSEWILSIDADERVSPALAAEIREAVRSESFDGYTIPFRNRLFGRELRYGGLGKERHFRLYRKSKGGFIQPIHERIEVSGAVGELKNEIIHESTATVSEYMKKLVSYTDLELKHGLAAAKTPSALETAVSPFLRFVYFYFFKLGFLDGRAGLLFHALSSFYHFIKLAKIRELRLYAKEN